MAHFVSSQWYPLRVICKVRNLKKKEQSKYLIVMKLPKLHFDCKQKCKYMKSIILHKYILCAHLPFTIFEF